MDNITFEKIWQDENLIELKISANSKFVSAYQSCYIQDKKLEEIADKIYNFVGNYSKTCYLEFGKKRRKLYTSVFNVYTPGRYIGTS